MTMPGKAVTGNDQPAPRAHDDWRAPALVLDDFREQLYLLYRVPSRVAQVRPQCRRVRQATVLALHG
jgi:hypothetical protein